MLSNRALLLPCRVCFCRRLKTEKHERIAGVSASLTWPLYTPFCVCLDMFCLNQAHKRFLFTYTEPTLKALFSELHPVCASWFKIGLELGIPHTELICFRKMHSDFSDSLYEMLVLWLKTAVDPPPTWEAVVTALRSPLVNENYLAARLEAKYCNQVQPMMGEFNSIQE